MRATPKGAPMGESKSRARMAAAWGSPSDPGGAWGAEGWPRGVMSSGVVPVPRVVGLGWLCTFKRDTYRGTCVCILMPRELPGESAVRASAVCKRSHGIQCKRTHAQATSFMH
eukprot:1137563-Pelagomonas_calceolata.AAC.4